jgi:hypothetical protein
VILCDNVILYIGTTDDDWCGYIYIYIATHVLQWCYGWSPTITGPLCGLTLHPSQSHGGKLLGIIPAFKLNFRGHEKGGRCRPYPWLVSSSGDSSSNPCGVKPNKNTVWLYSVGLCWIIWIEPSLSLSLPPSLLICKRKQCGNKYTPKTFFLLFVWQAHGLYYMVKWYLRWSGSQRDGPLRDLDLVLELLISRAKRNSQKCEGSWRTEEIASLYIVYTYIVWPCHTSNRQRKPIGRAISLLDSFFECVCWCDQWKGFRLAGPTPKSKDTAKHMKNKLTSFQ